MMAKDKALKLALHALKDHVGNYKLNAAGCTQQAAAITAIKEALAQQEAEAHLQAVSDFGQLQAQSEQEPVAVFDVGVNESIGAVRLLVHTGQPLKNGDKLYTAPPKREWVNLTVEQIEDVGFNLLPTVARKYFVAFARYVEMLSKEKNT